MSKTRSLPSAQKQPKKTKLATGYLLLNEADEIVYANKQARHFLGMLAEETLPNGNRFLPLVQSAYHCYPTLAWQDWPKRPSSINTRYLIYAPPNGHAFSLLKVEIVEQLIVDGHAIWAIAIDLVESTSVTQTVCANIQEIYRRQA